MTRPSAELRNFLRNLITPIWAMDKWAIGNNVRRKLRNYI